MEMGISIKHNKNQDVFNKNDDKSKNQTKRKAALHTKCHFVNNLKHTFVCFYFSSLGI